MNPCPSCKKPPFGIIRSAPTWIDGAPYAALQCGSCKYVVGIIKESAMVRGPVAHVEALWKEFTK
jgi:hypothetical protein